MKQSLGLRFLPMLLAFVMAVAPISTDMYLPAFPALRAEFSSDASVASLTLAAWFGGIAVGELVHGPLSDRFGRRTPLLLGFAVYSAASAACALASSMTELILFRMIAAFGGAAGLVVPLAIIRDVANSSDQAAQIFSRLQIIMSVIPILAPTVGALIVQVAGWRAIFWIALTYGLICAALTWRFLPETHPATSRSREQLASVGLHYLRVVRERTFATHALTGGFATFSLFAFLGSAPSIFLIHFGMTPTSFGAMFIANSAGFAVGLWLNSLLMTRLGRPRVLTLGVCALLTGSACMLLLALSNTGGLWGVEGPMIAIMVALGCLLTDVAIGAIEPHGDDAGIASAVYGTIVFAIGAFGTIGAGYIGHGDRVPLAGLILLGAMLALAASLLRPVPELEVRV